MYVINTLLQYESVLTNNRKTERPELVCSYDVHSVVKEREKNSVNLTLTTIRVEDLRQDADTARQKTAVHLYVMPQQNFMKQMQQNIQ